jgi:hypothetical protein
VKNRCFSFVIGVLLLVSLHAQQPAGPVPAATNPPAATATTTNKPAPAAVTATNPPPSIPASTNQPPAPQPTTNQPPAQPATNQVAATPAPAPAPKPQPPQPAAEQLLPAETTLMFTIKDFVATTNNFWKSAMGRLWHDDAMRATRDKFNGRWTNEVTNPIEKDFKIKLGDYAELLRGQLTFALTRPVEEGKGPGFVLLIDTKDKWEILKTRLAEIQKKWTEGDRKLKTEKIRDIEFASYEFTQAQLQQFARTITGKGEGAPDPEAATNKINLLVGQSQSLLLIGSQRRDLEKILARQSGGNVPPLADQPTFQANYNSLFRDAAVFGWLDFKPIFDTLITPRTAAAAQARGIENLRVEKVIPALGLGELKSLGLRIGAGPEGYDTTIFLTAPEAARHGLLKILAPPAKDAAPPAFVPADAVKFQRIRIDFQQAWTTFENVLNKIDPSVAGVVQLLLNAAGKDKDPNFDLKKSLVESIGDDFISYEKAAKNGAERTISLVGARNPEQLLSAIRAIMRMLPEPIGGAAMKEREFLGRKIYSLTPPPPATPLELTASANYVVISRDNAMLEEFLRSGEAPPKPLRELAGFNDAAQKVGGLNTGWFTFENQIETMRAAIDEAKTNPDGPADPGFNLNPISARSSLVSDWIDYQSLPPYDQIAKYFYYSLLTATATPEGITFKIAAPTPPSLK